jgi:hypothetical protein
MGETYTPFTWLNGAGLTEITAERLNNIEQGVESMDDRVTLLESGASVLAVDATGTTDAAPTIAAAITALGSGGGVLRLPPGSVRLSSRVTIAAPNIVLAGAGAGQTTIVAASGIGANEVVQLTWRSPLPPRRTTRGSGWLRQTRGSSESRSPVAPPVRCAGSPPTPPPRTP